MHVKWLPAFTRTPSATQISRSWMRILPMAWWPFNLATSKKLRGSYKGVSLSRPDTDQPHSLRTVKSGTLCLSFLARTQCFLGDLDRGRSTINHGLAIAAIRARDPGHIYGYVNVLIHAVRVFHLCGDLESEKRLATETINISRRNHYAYYEALSMCHLGWVAGAEGSLREGIDKMVDGLAALKANSH